MRAGSAPRCGPSLAFPYPPQAVAEDHASNRPLNLWLAYFSGFGSQTKADMKRARFSEEQIIGVLKEAEAGAKVSELCWRHGISDATFYTWRSKYGGLEWT